MIRLATPLFAWILLIVCGCGPVAVSTDRPDRDRPDEPPVVNDDPRAEVDPSAAPMLDRAEILRSVQSAMDMSAEPCDDFYRFACGAWLDSTELPADRSRYARSFSVIREANEEWIRSFLDEAATSTSPDPVVARIGVYYGSCMDEEAVEAAGITPLLGPLSSLEGQMDSAGLMRMVAGLHVLGARPFFWAGAEPDFKDPTSNILFVSQGGLGLPDRDYYVDDSERGQGIIAAYKDHVAAMLRLSGTPPEEAGGLAQQIYDFETALADKSRPRQDMRDPEKLYNRVELAGLEALAPDLDWDALLAAWNEQDITQISVAVPEYFEALNTLIPATEPAVLKAYMRWHLVRSAAPYLSKAFVDENFLFYGKTLRGQAEQRPRWKRCVSNTDRALGEFVGQFYVKENFAGSSRPTALEMVDDIEKAFEAGLDELPWMDDETRAAAVGKAQAVTNKIGHPEVWRDYEGLRLEEGNWFGNAMSSRSFEFRRDLAKVGKEVDKAEWYMSPAMVNAYYNPLVNEIVFPAGILQRPFFHKDFPPAMNYGGIGMVIGHELTHGFDDGGRKFDKDGRMTQWWTDSAIANYEAAADCVVDQYNGYEVQPGLSLNGELTLGENIADIGGLKLAYRAYKRWEDRNGEPEKLTRSLSNDQLFFVSFAQTWCSLSTPEVEQQMVKTDSHSHARYRVIGSIANNEDFREAFLCRPGDPMAPEKTCTVW